MEANEKEQQAVVAYIRRENGKLLSVTRKNTGQHSAPGGKVEVDGMGNPIETLVDAMKREVREEVGIDVLAWTLVHEGLHTSGRRVFSYHVWGWRGEPIAREPGTTVAWVDPIEIANGFGSEYHSVALQAAGLWKPVPYEVVVKGRDLVLGYACPVCKFFHGATIYACKWEDALVASRESAERCCNLKCEDCEKRVERKYYAVCNDCGRKRDAAREQERFDKAKKIPISNYNGWLCWCGEQFADEDALADHCTENDLEWPEWVWACKKIEFKIDVDTILEHALQDHYEDARDSIPQAAEDNLQAILDEWCAGQGIESWQEDNSRAVMLESRKLVDDD